MDFVVGRNGHICIQFHDLTPTEITKLVGDIIGQVYNLEKQKKDAITICSTCLPLSSDGENKQEY